VLRSLQSVSHGAIPEILIRVGLVLAEGVASLFWLQCASTPADAPADNTEHG